jgi:hypothetical protein
MPEGPALSSQQCQIGIPIRAVNFFPSNLLQHSPFPIPTGDFCKGTVAIFDLLFDLDIRQVPCNSIMSRGIHATKLGEQACLICDGPATVA